MSGRKVGPPGGTAPTHRPPLPERLAPGLALRRNGRPIAASGLTVGAFWAWAFSDLRQNATRGHLAEFIVAAGLGVPLTVRSAWDDYDLLVPEGVLVPSPVRVQIKSAGYLQAWPQRQLSAISFDGLRRRAFPWTEQHGFKLGDIKAPKADVFVFAIETAKSHDRYDPLAVDQWEFRVLSAAEIDQDSLGYPTLCRLVGAVAFDGLAEAVRAAAISRRQKLAGAKAALRKAVKAGDEEAAKRWAARVAELEA